MQDISGASDRADLLRPRPLGAPGDGVLDLLVVPGNRTVVRLADRESGCQRGRSPAACRRCRDVELEPVWREADGDARAAEVVIGGGEQRCLDHPVGDQVHSGCQVDRVVQGAQSAGQARPGGRLDLGAGSARAGVVVLAEHAEQAAQIG